MPKSIILLVKQEFMLWRMVVAVENRNPFHKCENRSMNRTYFLKS